MRDYTSNAKVSKVFIAASTMSDSMPKGPMRGNYSRYFELSADALGTIGCVGNVKR